MKKLVSTGLLLATLALAGTTFAGEGGMLQERELQKLFEWSAEAFKRVNPGEHTANPGGQAAGPGAQPTKPVPPVLEHRGSTIK
ncbi:MAG: hypothetical protein L0214_10175 [candidate division NC10 bacterium]|nr:hypothetical protein [candidate division NC10 bacterium]